MADDPSRPFQDRADRRRAGDRPRPRGRSRVDCRRPGDAGQRDARADARPHAAARPGAARRAGSPTASRCGCAIMTRRCTGACTPAEPAARACFDAIERVRYEALGENNYAGMRDNLAAAIEQRTATDPIIARDQRRRGAAADRGGAAAARAADRPADARGGARRGRAGARVSSRAAPATTSSGWR